MKKDKRIHVTLSSGIRESLEKKSKESGTSISKLVEKSLDQFLAPTQTREYDKVHYPMTYKECEKLADEQLKSDMAATVLGLTIPEVSSVKKEPDPEIKKAFSISGEIKEGPGVTQRLAAVGIKPLDIIRAKRAKSMGNTYDMSLEKYFELI